MSSEAALRAIVRKNLSHFGRLYRIESPITSGIPDINYLLRFPINAKAVSGWLELKEEEPPKRASTPIRIKSLTFEQVFWHEDYTNSGGRVYTLILLGDNYVLVNSRQLKELYERKMTLSDLREKSLIFAEKHFPVSGILKALAGGQNESVDLRR